MTRFRVSKAVYLDTNTLIYAGFSLRRPENAPELKYYEIGDQVVEALRRCEQLGVRVFSTDLAYLEMHHNHHQWAWYKEALDLGAPPGLIFGEKGRRMDPALFRSSLSEAAQEAALQDTAQWLERWEFATLVEYKQPEEIPNWFEIARCIYAHFMETVLDCLHMAAAISLECDYFLTEDKPLRELMTEMRQSTTFRQVLQQQAGVPEDYGLPDPAKPKSLFAPS